MNKNKCKSFLILLTTLVGVVACNASGANSDINPSVPSSIESSQISSLDSSLTSTEESSIVSSSSEIQINENTRYESQTWDTTINKMIEYTIGEGYKKVPVLQASAYMGYFENVSTTDMYGEGINILSTRILCGGISAAAAEGYATSLENNGFIYSSDYDCYYAKASALECYYVFLTYSKKTEKFNIQTYKKQIRDNVWEKDACYLILGRDIPYITCGAYEYYFDKYTISLYVYFVDVTDAQIVEYKTALINDGWYRSSTSATDDVYSCTKDSDLKITIEQGLDSFNDTYLMLHLENTWPFYLIYASTEGELPKSSYGTFFGYSTNESEKGDYYTQIEYDNVPQEGYVSYCNELASMKYGYSLDKSLEDYQGSYESTSEGYGTIYYSYYAKGNALVDVMYSSGLERLIIIIWA